MVLMWMAAIARGPQETEPRLDLRDVVHMASRTPMRQGLFRVFEDREARSGRVLELDVVVLPASEEPAE